MNVFRAALARDFWITGIAIVRYMPRAFRVKQVDGTNAARSFLKGRGISTQQIQVVWDAIALHTTRSIALHKEPEVAMTHSGIAADVLGAGLDRIPQDQQGAILAEFPRLALKTN